jgi:hypothetical protein
MTRRLAQVVVGAAREAPDRVGLGDPAGRQDHRQVRIDSRGETVGVAHAVDHLQAAAVLERKVEQDEARSSHLDRTNALPGARRASDSEAIGGEVLEQECPRRIVVLDHQDEALLVHARLSSPVGFLRPRDVGSPDAGPAS